MARLCALPDKFRGSLSARGVGEAVAAAVGRAGGSWQVVVQPLSDGGEGFAEVLAPAGEIRSTTVTGPSGTPVLAEWRFTRGAHGKHSAVIEAAAACGLELAGGPDAGRCLTATTRGVGELIAAARDAGADEILVGLGGSASTDGGVGALEALGALPNGRAADLGRVLGRARLLVACDVDAHFVDAARLFAPQKGATPELVDRLTGRLQALRERYLEAAGIDVGVIAGSGAAGGLAGGLALIGGELRSGSELVGDAVGLAGLVERADAIVTGEGRLDAGSFTGKVVGHVLDTWRRSGREVPVLVVAGTASPEGADRVRSTGATVVALDELVGLEASLSEPRSAVTGAVADWLAGLSAPGR